jgi:glycosyltransferase involved in cell wall biosynthesis
MTEDRKKLLLFTDWYLPGFKAGGPIQSCHNIVKMLGSKYQFYIFTSDRDWGESRPYPDIVLNKWITADHGVQIFYATPDYLKIKNLATAVNTVQPDIIYFNSMFSQYFTLMPLWMLKQTNYRGRIALAPRGMLQAGALMQKNFKKRVFLHLFKLSGWPARIIFHATDEQERKDILKFFPSAKNVQVAENIPNVDKCAAVNRVKLPGVLRMVFISRVHPKKNLHFLLEILKSGSFDGNIWLDVFGLAEDPEYLAVCKRLISAMPENIRVNFAGPLPHAKVFETLRASHLFTLPTLGENFGHAIFEALSSGTPVLISDQTPWKNMEAVSAGWDIPLQNASQYHTVINKALEMDEKEYAQWANGAKTYSENFLVNFDFVSRYTSLFQ